MKNLYLLSIFVISFTFLSSCSQSVSKDDLNMLEGYWEITKVILPDGQEKEYSINTTVDFFELKEEGDIVQGVRQKVMPQFNGEYLTNDIVEHFSVDFQDGGTWLNYSTDYATWKEKIMDLSHDEMKMENEQGLVYYYKRYTGFSLK